MPCFMKSFFSDFRRLESQRGGTWNAQTTEPSRLGTVEHSLAA